MKDPYIILGVAPSDSDEIIRKRYLELIRENPPEVRPELFNQIHAAYNAVKTVEARVSFRLFHEGPQETIEDIVDDLKKKMPLPRISIKQLAKLRKMS